MAVDERTFRIADLELLLTELRVGSNARLALSRGENSDRTEKQRSIEAGIAVGIDHAIDRISHRFSIDVPYVGDSAVDKMT